MRFPVEASRNCKKVMCFRRVIDAEVPINVNRLAPYRIDDWKTGQLSKAIALNRGDQSTANAENDSKVFGLIGSSQAATIELISGAECAGCDCQLDFLKRKKPPESRTNNGCATASRTNRIFLNERSNTGLDQFQIAFFSSCQSKMMQSSNEILCITSRSDTSRQCWMRLARARSSEISIGRLWIIQLNRLAMLQCVNLSKWSISVGDASIWSRQSQ